MNVFNQINSNINDTVCPRSSDPFYVVTYYIKWVTTSWTHSIIYYLTAIAYIGTRFLDFNEDRRQAFCLNCWQVLGDPEVTTNNHETFPLSVLWRLLDYLRLLLLPCTKRKLVTRSCLNDKVIYLVLKHKKNCRWIIPLPPLSSLEPKQFVNSLPNFRILDVKIQNWEKRSILNRHAV